MINKNQRLGIVCWEFSIYLTGCAAGMAIYKMFILTGLLGAVLMSVLFSVGVFISVKRYALLFVTRGTGKQTRRRS